jgi:hypothetical protein
MPLRFVGLPLVAIVGLTVGVYFGDQRGRLAADVSVMGDLYHEAALQAFVFAEGTDATREQAILAHLSFEFRMRPKYSEADYFRAAESGPDEEFAYARLADIAERSGRLAASGDYIGKAIAQCLTRHSAPRRRENCTEGQLRDLGARLNRIASGQSSTARP